jgi:hypothetical protein
MTGHNVVDGVARQNLDSAERTAMAESHAEKVVRKGLRRGGVFRAVWKLDPA